MPAGQIPVSGSGISQASGVYGGNAPLITYTYAQLPSAASQPVGTVQYTSDQGLVYSNGSTWNSIGGSASAGATTINVKASGDTSGVTDSAAVKAAIAALVVLGGGTVNMYAGMFYFATPPAPASGVSIQGYTPALNYTTDSAPIPDSSQVLANGGGTVINCLGGFGFQWNKTALGVPTGNAWISTAPTNFAFRNLGFFNYARALDAGNTNNYTGWYGKFQDSYFTQGTDWGLWLTNFQHCQFERIFSYGNTTGQQYYGNDMPSSVLEPGNSTWKDCYSVANGNTPRGFVMLVNQGQQNEGFMSRIQSNRFNASVVTTAATMANGSTSITVASATNLALNMPVTVSATANGFTVNQTYFIASIAGTTLTLASTVGGAAISATGATAVNLISQGYACLELVALPGAQLTGHNVQNIDVEGGGTCAILAQNCSWLTLGISQLPLAAQSTQGLCMRGCVNVNVVSPNGSNTDFDNSSPSAAITYLGQRKAGCVGYMGQGFWYDANSTYAVLGSGSSSDNQQNGLINLVAGLLAMPGSIGIGQKANFNGSAGPTIGNGQLNAATVIGTSGTTVTLPTITSQQNGAIFSCSNPGANAAAITLNTNGTQTFNGVAGRTALTINPGASVRLCAVLGPSSTYYWMIEGIGGTYSSGVISSV